MDSSSQLFQNPRNPEITFEQNFKFEKWFNEDGEIYNSSAPAIIKFDRTGKKVSEEWYTKKNTLHRVDGPAITEYNDDKTREVWCYDGTIHRTDDGPSIVNRLNGKVVSQYWNKDGKQHRINGPAVIEYYEDGNKKLEEWYIEGRLHRLDGPAQVKYENWNGIDNDKKKFEGWYKNGGKYRYIRYENGYKQYEFWGENDTLLHRVDGPACIYYNELGIKEREEWYQNGKCFRRGGPAVIKYHQNGKKMSEEWHNENGILHREQPSRDSPHFNKDPAFISYDENGVIKSQEWYYEGFCHRTNDEPAIIGYQNGFKIIELWKLNGKLHRLYKPALVKYYENGIVKCQQHYIEGILKYGTEYDTAYDSD